MHFVEVKSPIKANNLNIYRGCQHGCIYCDSRSECYHIEHEFTDVEVKKNILDLLEIKLSKLKKPIMIGTGSMSDPYMPLEKDLKYTRRLLELIDKYHCGVRLLTKSTLVLRDLDLLVKINKHSKVIVEFTMTTFDEKICKLVEPNVSSTKSRYEALKILHDNGIQTGVWLCPFLPGINDTYENVTELLRYCVNAKVNHIVCFGIGLTLRKGNREYFYKCLDKSFPGLKDKYIKQYGNSYQIVSPNNDRIMGLVYGICRKYHILCDMKEIFTSTYQYESHENKKSISE